MNEHGKVSAAAIFGDVGDLGLRYARVWVVAAGFLAAVMTGLDIALAGSGEALANIMGSILSFFVSYHVVETILRGESLQVSSGRSYGSLFGASILTSLGIGLAFLVLIVPGIYCMARWSMVTPLIVAEGRGTTEAMSESWERTKDSVWSLASVYVVYFLSIVALIFVAAMAGELGGLPDEAVAGTGSVGVIMPFVVNLASVAIGLVGNLIAIAIYRALAGSGAQYEDVFG
ncbi:hypothetical protein GGQ88_001511 [Novosphingobium hassiacum]|uniref:Glycerophosphoryl diester phosphodiesterase membrane domain-containing protein n=1 Tax=Novosphingobium hassiacum TaxID=173676 RepID=A0A7W5ZUL0_9SPHN|nr:glycerophosphoryl diester phosphodiesterase membrane domain-containing protein [Novosphingobium hassiacum]MBB3860245.1 hypothetical protein [Novosphingobium hassiacum]